MPANIIGTTAAETFSVRGTELSGGTIDGGGETDVLELRDFFYPTLFDFTGLTRFQGIEVIRGVIEVAQIRIRADQLANVTTIDSYDVQHVDQVMIVGGSIDLRTINLLGSLEIRPETANAEVAVANFATASLIKSEGVRGIHAKLETGILTDAQRVALYDRGIDKITDASGVTTAAFGPVLTGLHGIL